MNIVLTIEELQAYQNAVEDHVRLSLTKEVVERMVERMNSAFVTGGSRTAMDDLRRFVDDQMKKHPLPKLVPNA